jgi:hypothetical protein
MSQAARAGGGTLVLTACLPLSPPARLPVAAATLHVQCEVGISGHAEGLGAAVARWAATCMCVLVAGVACIQGGIPLLHVTPFCVAHKKA